MMVMTRRLVASVELVTQYQFRLLSLRLDLDWNLVQRLLGVNGKL
jgi:hypothetical protein